MPLIIGTTTSADPIPKPSRSSTAIANLLGMHSADKPDLHSTRGSYVSGTQVAYKLAKTQLQQLRYVSDYKFTLR
jgi:hypothetical protein